jgi:hypothetical protein
MEETHNPFTKLHDILNIARQEAPHAITLDVWAKVFNFTSTDTLAMVKAFSSLINLVAEARAAAEKFIPGEKSRFLAPLDKVDALLSNQNITVQWGQHKAYLDDVTMLGLDFGVYAMSQYYPAANSESPLQINEFVAKLNTLLEDCLSSDLSPELKKLFTRHLESLRAALLAFRVDGVKGLEEELDNIMGSILRHREPIKSESAGGKEFIKGFFEILGKVNDVVSGYQTTVQIAGSTAVTLLLPMIS